MKKDPQQELPFPRWGGARRGAGRKRKSERKNVPHRIRTQFRKGALHVTVRIRREVWNLRTHRCFRALRRAFERGCERFGFRLVHFSVQGNHMHFVVEAPDAVTLGRAMKGLEVRMARALNKVMDRKGPVFADRRRPVPRAPASFPARGGAGDPVRARQLDRARGPRRPGGAVRRGPLLLGGAARAWAAAGRGASVVDADRWGTEVPGARRGSLDAEPPAAPSASCSGNQSNLPCAAGAPVAGSATFSSSFGYVASSRSGTRTRFPVTSASSISALVTAWPAKWLLFTT